MEEHSIAALFLYRREAIKNEYERRSIRVRAAFSGGLSGCTVSRSELAIDPIEGESEGRLVDLYEK